MGKYVISGWAICTGQPYPILWLNVHDIGMQTTAPAPTNEILDYLTRSLNIEELTQYPIKVVLMSPLWPPPIILEGLGQHTFV